MLENKSVFWLLQELHAFLKVCFQDKFKEMLSKWFQKPQHHFLGHQQNREMKGNTLPCSSSVPSRLGKFHRRNEPVYCRGNLRSISREVTVRLLSLYSIKSWPYLCEMQCGWAWEIGGHILLGQRGHKVIVSSPNLWACSACCSWFGFCFGWGLMWAGRVEPSHSYTSLVVTVWVQQYLFLNSFVPFWRSLYS